ncbi:S-layer homology domain-containing protein [Paenibacillus aestuarii]|uniref:S-layer homology domain-containing protein n=1 Tax=Paenibacillus aestuarii TaxID=516965 RepID=A0ABW0KC49_9BACL|nr:S-layer homology domain-containing protein [Paenibacillus aestuarii]
MISVLHRPARKWISTMLVPALVVTSTFGLTTGTGTVHAASGFTPPQAVFDHLQQDDWSEIHDVLSNVYGSITTPLNISDVDKGSYTTGQLMGNGDIGAIAAGVSPTSQQFYFAKNDFWGTLHAQGSSVKDNAGILSGGGLDIWPTQGGGSQSAASFQMKQDILNAQVVTQMQLSNDKGNDADIELRSWTADTDNVFVTEVQNKSSDSITLNTKQWVPAMAYASGSATDLTDAQTTYPYTGGIDMTGANPVLWTTRDTNAGNSGNTTGFRSRMATATTVVGTTLTNTKEKIEANDYYDSNKGKYYNSLGESGDFTVGANASVYLVTYFASSSGAYDQIGSVSDVQTKAVSGLTAYTSKSAIDQLKAEHLNWWKNYWLKSYAQFNDVELNQYYYSSLYILGSSNRPTSANGKVNAQNLPASMYGEWVPADNVGWGGRYFLNYNQQAHYYASGSTNRIETAVPYNRVIAYDRPWQINNAVDQGFDGAVHVRTLSPFHLMAQAQVDADPKAATKTYGFSSGSTDQKSNGMFAVVPMIFYYEYTLDDGYLRDVLYPYLKDLLTFYSSYVLKQDDSNGQYHYSVIGSSIHEGDAADINPDLDIGAIKYMSKFLISHAAAMNEDQANIDRWQDLMEHTAYPEAMLPKGIFNAANTGNLVPTLIATDYQSPDQPHVDMIEPGDQPVELEGVVFPFENAQMLDGDKELLQKVRNTLEYMNAWAASGFAGWSSQNNGFPKVYAIAARAGWPAADLLAKFKTALKAKLRSSNLTYYGSGGAVETIASMEGLNSMLLQSDTTPNMPSTIWVFPNWDQSRSVSFERLGAKGNVEVSSTFDAATQTVPYVDIHSRREGQIALVHPWSAGKPVIQVVNNDNTLGDAVPYTIHGGKIIFDAHADTRYMVMNDITDATSHVTDLALDKYAANLIYQGGNGSDSAVVTATVYGNAGGMVTWSSSDSSVVTVEGHGHTATLKAVGTGANKVANVTVTATSADDGGVAQTIKVKVADASTVPTSLTMVSPGKATIYGPGSTDASTAKVSATDRLQLTAFISPVNAYDKRILWKSDKPNVAMVDKNGLVIARGTGTATVTGTSMANPSLPPITSIVTVTSSGTDFSGDATLASVINAAKSISAYAGDKTGSGGFTQKSSSPNWEGMQENFQKAYINALGVKDKYAGYSTFNISRDTAFFTAVALNEAIRSIDPSKALTIVQDVDKSALVSAIDSASKLKADNFDTEEDWANLQAALAAAQSVNSDPAAKQADVDNAYEALKAAMSKVASMPTSSGGVPVIQANTVTADVYGSRFVQMQAPLGTWKWTVANADGSASTAATIDPNGGLLYATAEGAYQVTATEVGGSSVYNSLIAFHQMSAITNLTMNGNGNGKVFGSTSSGSYPPTNVFDGSTSTFFDHSTSEPYVGWDFGQPVAANVIRFLPRTGSNAARIFGAKLQGSNTSQSSGYVDLLTITDAISNGTSSSWFIKNLSNTTGYRYYRWLGTNGSHGNVAEIQLFVNVDKTELGKALNAAQSLVASNYTERSWEVMQSAMTNADLVFNNPTAGQADIDAAAAEVRSAMDGLQVAEGSVLAIAAGITSIAPPAKDAVMLILPTVPAGFTIAIHSSSDPVVIATYGAIQPQDTDVTVHLVLEVTAESDHSQALTNSIPVVVPAGSTAAEIAAGITAIAQPAKDALSLALPQVPPGFTIGIKSSSNTVVLDTYGNITPPVKYTTVYLVLEVTKLANQTKADTGAIQVNVLPKSGDDKGNGGSVNSGGSGSPSQPEQPQTGTQLVTSEDLAQLNAEGSVSIPISSDVLQVALPARSAELLAGHPLVIQSDKLSLTIPAEVLAQLADQLSGDDLLTSTIQLSVKPLSGTEAQSLLAKGETLSGADLQLSGEIFDFSLSLVTKDGHVTSSLSSFNQPLTIRLKTDAAMNPDLLGIYYIADNGQLEYVGGRFEQGELVAEIHHFSKYAVLAFKKSFADVPSTHWAAEAIAALTARHIANGTSDTAFEPERSVTRAEFTALLVRALHLTAAGEQKFADVNAQAWYAEPIAIAVKAGIAGGRSDQAFAPDMQITREEMVTMLMRAYALAKGTKPNDKAAVSFSDESAIAPWALVDVKEAAALQLVNGREADKFVPGGISTRAEAAALIYRMLK